MKQKNTLLNWLFRGYPPLFTIFLLWLWKRNNKIQIIIVVIFAFFMVLSPFVVLYFILKYEAWRFLAYLIFIYFYIFIWVKYFDKAGDEARDIYEKRER